jgi:hypothetical protein
MNKETEEGCNRLYRPRHRMQHDNNRAEPNACSSLDPFEHGLITAAAAYHECSPPLQLASARYCVQSLSAYL